MMSIAKSSLWTYWADLPLAQRTKWMWTQQVRFVAENGRNQTIEMSQTTRESAGTCCYAVQLQEERNELAAVWKIFKKVTIALWAVPLSRLKCALHHQSRRRIACNNASGHALLWAFKMIAVISLTGSRSTHLYALLF